LVEDKIVPAVLLPHEAK